jgi:segregation and condensation protein B
LSCDLIIGPAPPSPGPSIEEPQETKISRLLAVLFLAKEPLSTRKLSQYANLADGTEARTLVTHLNQKLDRTRRAFRAEHVAGGYQLVTRPKFAKWLRRLEYVPVEIRLSAPAMETLAVVAYRQPVVRADVEAVRGVSCGEILSQLLNRDLIRISGRSDELGRPYLYNTTKRFLQVFGLKTLDQLPLADVWQSESHWALGGEEHGHEEENGNEQVEEELT